MRFDEAWLADYQARSATVRQKDAKRVERLHERLEPKRSKFCAVPVVIDGIRFASTGEGNRYQELRLLEKAGTISDIQCQPKFPIMLNGKLICHVIGDFSYTEAGRKVVEDFKGFDNPLSRIKRKMVCAIYQDLDWRIVTR